MTKTCCTIIAAIFLLATTGFSQLLYEIPVKDIEGNNINLKTYMGKKILFLIVPLNSDDSVLIQLDSFLIKYSGKIKVIGILSAEDGYSPVKKTSIKQLYNSRGIVLTEVMKTRKGQSQQPLMQWLTNRSKNNHFDMDAMGIGHKFFVSETGRLFAVLPPRASLTYPMISRIVNSGLPVN
jgi:glutathione peroxidase